MNDFIRKNSMHLNYKFVVLGNGNDWCEISYADIKKIPNAKLLNELLPCNYSKLLSRIAKLHYSQTLSHYINLPWKEKWFAYFARSICADPKARLIIIIFDKHIFANDGLFLTFLKSYFINAKFVYVFTNVVSKSGAKENGFLDKLNLFYDLVYTYDFGDVRKYGYRYFPNVYSSIKDPGIKAEKKVFFVGKAKDRLNFLLQVYERFLNLGVSCEFYIIGVPLELQVHRDSIRYNKPLTYRQVVKKVQESCCILDITQGESEGFTLRINESVFYNKLLITNNKRIKEAPFYNSDFIKVISSPQDIDESIFDNYKSVNFSDGEKKYFEVESFFTNIINSV